MMKKNADWIKIQIHCMKTDRTITNILIYSYEPNRIMMEKLWTNLCQRALQAGITGKETGWRSHSRQL